MKQFLHRASGWKDQLDWWCVRAHNKRSVTTATDWLMPKVMIKLIILIELVTGINMSCVFKHLVIRYKHRDETQHLVSTPGCV
ncbi:MAG: hypothetical protein EBY62_09235 [Cellvibrionales bacterium]|nr:hypothetical protein [Cellvibrionales bacterium]